MVFLCSFGCHLSFSKWLWCAILFGVLTDHRHLKSSRTLLEWLVPFSRPHFPASPHKITTCCHNLSATSTISIIASYPHPWIILPFFQPWQLLILCTILVPMMTKPKRNLEEGILVEHILMTVPISNLDWRSWSWQRQCPVWASCLAFPCLHSDEQAIFCVFIRIWCGQNERYVHSTHDGSQDF